MTRYLVRAKNKQYISRYTPPTEKKPYPQVSYTRYRFRAQIFSAEEVNRIPKIYGDPVQIEM